MKTDASAEKLRPMRAVIGSIEKQFGKGSLMALGDDDGSSDIRIIHTGSIALDRALGVGGYPRGRVIEIFGPESSGKTTLALHAMREAQREGGVAAFIDAEHALDVGYARGIGINPERLLVSQPDSGEQALEIVEMLARSGAVDVVAIDSVAALVPRAELDGDLGDPNTSTQARLMSQALRKLTSVAHRTDTAIIFVNQLRHKSGVLFGSSETTTGGNALKFYASVRLDVRRVGAVRVGDETVGARARVKVVKNKCAAPFREAEFDIRWGRGIDALGELIDLGVLVGAIEKNSSGLYWQGEHIGHGRERARETLRARPELEGKLRAAIEAASSLESTKCREAAE